MPAVEAAEEWRAIGSRSNSRRQSANASPFAQTEVTYSRISSSLHLSISLSIHGVNSYLQSSKKHFSTAVTNSVLGGGPPYERVRPLSLRPIASSILASIRNTTASGSDDPTVLRASDALALLHDRHTRARRIRATQLPSHPHSLYPGHLQCVHARSDPHVLHGAVYRLNRGLRNIDCDHSANANIPHHLKTPTSLAPSHTQK
jgi:hypothetical protein